MAIVLLNHPRIGMAQVLSDYKQGRCTKTAFATLPATHDQAHRHRWRANARLSRYRFRARRSHGLSRFPQKFGRRAHFWEPPRRSRHLMVHLDRDQPLQRKRAMYRAAILTILSVLIGFATAAADPAAKPSDPQIAHIAYTADQLDIEAAKQALQKSKNPQVIAFANQMVGDHTMVNDQALALVKKLNVTPEDNPTSQTLTTQAEATRNKLASLEGAAFDKAYVDNEVAYHKTVNTALSGTLIPGAQNPELKALLQNGLTLFEAHQKHAEQLAGQLH